MTNCVLLDCSAFMLPDGADGIALVLVVFLVGMLLFAIIKKEPIKRK